MNYQAVIIGGGFYGTAIAIYLAKVRGLKRLLLIERESSILARASFNNQARIHNGYHYPRSFTTAYRSRINFPKFLDDWSFSVFNNFTKVYAIAKHNSKVTAKQFTRFCHNIGANFELAPECIESLFNPRLIDSVFRVEEYAFDSTKLAQWGNRSLQELAIDTRLQTTVIKVLKNADGGFNIIVEDEKGEQTTVSTPLVFNCTYSGINQITGDFSGVSTSLKHEITEIALIKPPPILKDLAITVMDGPFFSLMHFPAKQLHTLTHVRYTPHLSWVDQARLNPYKRLSRYHQASRVDRMLRDVNRYLPVINQAQYVESLFEIKTVLMKNETDDGRPILFEKHKNLPGCYSILGSKIDNIYDVFNKLDEESLS